jgi:glycosyltransferase involved in cell wall biosynthesis
MYKNNKIGVVVPSYNVRHLIGRVIETMPDFVDKIVIVNDTSKDDTQQVVESYQPKNKKIVLINHEVNQGVGGAIASGYKWCRDNQVDIAVVMAGDAQMDPQDLPKLLDLIIEGKADYTKGNRLFTGDAWNIIPRDRYLGNSALSFMTKIASGYWHVADSQCGYTAINKSALKMINWDQMYKRYGQPNDLLVRLNIYDFVVADVPVTPVYDIGEKSGFKPFKMIPKLSWLLLKIFLYRMTQKYIIRDFHPLVLFYATGFMLGVLDLVFIIRFIVRWISLGVTPEITLFLIIFCTFSSLQCFLFAMLFDFELNRKLRIQ